MEELRKETFEEVVQAIKKEHKYRDNKWGGIEEHSHTQSEWFNILLQEVIEAKNANIVTDKEEFKNEMIQIAAVVFAYLEQHGLPERSGR